MADALPLGVVGVAALPLRLDLCARARGAPPSAADARDARAAAHERVVVAARGARRVRSATRWRAHAQGAHRWLKMSSFSAGDSCAICAEVMFLSWACARERLSGPIQPRPRAGPHQRVERVAEVLRVVRVPAVRHAALERRPVRVCARRNAPEFPHSISAPADRARRGAAHRTGPRLRRGLSAGGQRGQRVAERRGLVGVELLRVVALRAVPAPRRARVNAVSARRRSFCGRRTESQGAAAARQMSCARRQGRARRRGRAPRRGPGCALAGSVIFQNRSDDELRLDPSHVTAEHRG